MLAPAQSADEIGRLGPYRILKVLGAGGMGVVFLAQDPQLDRLLAIKAMKPVRAASDSARKRFLREARLAASITNDHIVAIHQVGEDPPSDAHSHRLSSLRPTAEGCELCRRADH